MADETKPDAVHDIAKWLDHNRWLIAGLIAGLALSACLVACQARVPSLIQPDKKVTASVYEQEKIRVEADLNRAAADLNATKEKYEAEIKASAEKHNATVAEVQKKIESNDAAIEQFNATKAQILEVAAGLATTAASGGTITPGAAVGAAVSIVSLLGLIGSTVNSRRKDSQITQRDEQIAKLETEIAALKTPKT